MSSENAARVKGFHTVELSLKAEPSYLGLVEWFGSLACHHFDT